VKENIFYDVDLIKVAIEDDISVAEMTAIVEEAHRRHLKVAVHAVSAGSIQTAIDAGVDSIEHGNDVTDKQLKLMRDKGIPRPDANLGRRLLDEDSRDDHSLSGPSIRECRQRRPKPEAGSGSGSAAIEVGSEVCHWIRHVLVLSRKNARPSHGNDVSHLA